MYAIDNNNEQAADSRGREGQQRSELVSRYFFQHLN
jgi:hypothetical protein